MLRKIGKIFFDFEIIAIWIGGVRHSLLLGEKSGVNMLTNSLKISDTTKTEFSELISFRSDQKI